MVGEADIIPGLSAGVTGAKREEEREVDVEFPSDYRLKSLCGKKAAYKVKVTGIRERVLPEMDEEFAKKFDADSDKFNLDGEIRGIGYNISRNLGYENDLWRLFSFNNPKSNGYLFFNEKNDLPDVLTALVEGLFRSARQSAIAINSIIASWG